MNHATKPKIGKARLTPVRFSTAGDGVFEKRLEKLKELLAGEAEWTRAVELGEPLPSEAHAAIFPEFLGEAYGRVEDFRGLGAPILVVTSEFGTFSMWDWEIASYMETLGVRMLMPYSLEQTRLYCRAIRLRRDLNESKFLVYWDNPGEGFQPEIFKLFYWYQPSWAQKLKEKYGVVIEQRSFKELGSRARALESDDAAMAAWAGANPSTGGSNSTNPESGSHGDSASPGSQAGGAAPANSPAGSSSSGESPSQRALAGAEKLYRALCRDLEGEGSVQGIGINCLNESHFSDTTPCAPFMRLFDERDLLWACEGDTVSLLTKWVLYKSLGAPVFMTNIYPYLVGMAALKHEKIDRFPDVPNPENCILIAHCGYLGLMPKRFSSTWALRPKVLGIVDENAHAVDARFCASRVTLAKFDTTLGRMLAVEGELEDYVQYPGSDCRNGGLIRIADGHALMEKAFSHHVCVLAGHLSREIAQIGKVFDFEVVKI